MNKKRIFKRIIFFLILVMVFLWTASMMEARIGGGQKYSSKGIKNSKGVKEKDGENHRCPSCGSSLKIGMMGKCSHSDSKITNGDFDWVLSMIEQDESYTG